jgi:tRNA threonylcarbamoyladenosine biosynthesis protein TsaE
VWIEQNVKQIGDRESVHRAASPAVPALQMRSASPRETQRLGAALGELLGAGDVVLLVGELGSGKTALTQGIGAGLAVEGPINSPTFTIVKEYSGRLPLYHFDLYRIEEPEELFALGFEEYFGGDGVAVVEWAEHGEDDEIGAAWPQSWLRVELRMTGVQERALAVTAAGSRGEQLLAAFAQAVHRQPAEGPLRGGGA